MTKNLIVDLNNIAHRTWFGINHKFKMRQTATEAVHSARDRLNTVNRIARSGTISTCLSLALSTGCDRIIWCADRGKSWRERYYPAYKETRNEGASPDVIEQHQMINGVIDDIVEWVKALDGFWFSDSAIEADDWIAYWVQGNPEDEHVIFSEDTDLYQLVREGVEQITPAGFLVSIDGKRKKIKVEVPDGLYRYGAHWSAPLVCKDQKTARPDWELHKLIKIIRGDRGDNIPPVESRRSISFIRALQATSEIGWNNWYNGTRHNDPSVRIAPLFDRNRLLIDLAQQPPEVRAQMDAFIDGRITMERIPREQAERNYEEFCRAHNNQDLLRQSARNLSLIRSD